MSIEEKLKKTILEKHKTLTEFCECADLKMSTLKMVLTRGINTTKSETLAKICIALKIEPLSLLNGEIKEHKHSIADMTHKEFDHLTKYRKLGKYGVELVDNVINIEIKRLEAEKEEE